MNAIIERDLYREIRRYLTDNEAIVIHGARQTGKTSLMHYIKQNLEDNAEHSFYIDLEDFAFVQLCNSGVDETIKYLYSKGHNLQDRFYLFIDEIQYLDNPSSFLKLFFDRYKGRIKLIVSGSSSFAIKSKFKDSLVGRIVDFELFPLSFHEFLRFKELKYKLGPDAASSDLTDSELKSLYREFCIYGGYPSIVLESESEKKEKKIKQIINTYIKADIRDLARIKNIHKFNHLLEILAGQTGNLLNIAELSVTVGIARQTIEDYLFILENTYIIRLLYPYHRNIRSELTKMPKIFFEDTGISNILINKRFAEVISGSSFENSLYSEIRKQLGTGPLNYWRTNKNQEIDFIVSKNKIIPLEVKMTFAGKELSSLKYFKEKYGLDKGYIITLEKKVQSPYDWLQVLYPWEIYKMDPEFLFNA